VYHCRKELSKRQKQGGLKSRFFFEKAVFEVNNVLKNQEQGVHNVQSVLKKSVKGFNKKWNF